MPTLYGVSPSPFVRKVLVVLHEKGLEVDHEPIFTTEARENWRHMSPLGKIPFFENQGTVIPDSSVIIAYIEKRHPKNSVYPSDSGDYARALWFEEYADTALRDAVLPFFFERVIKPMRDEGAPDEARLGQVASDEIPIIFNYLEEQLGGREWLVGDAFSIADIAVGTQFVNYGYGKEPVDAGRWPNLAAYVGRVHARPSFQAAVAKDEALFASVPA